MTRELIFVPRSKSENTTLFGLKTILNRNPCLQAIKNNVLTNLLSGERIVICSIKILKHDVELKQSILDDPITTVGKSRNQCSDYYQDKNKTNPHYDHTYIPINKDSLLGPHGNIYEY